MKSTVGLQRNDLMIVNPGITTRYPGLWRVERLLQVNVVLTPVRREGDTYVPTGGRNLRIRPEYLLPAPATSEDDTTQAAAVLIKIADPLHVGQVVTVADITHRIPAETLYVVLRDRGETVSLVKLGGDNGTYWPRVPRAWVNPYSAAALEDLLTR